MSYNDLVEFEHDNYTTAGLIDNLFLDLCKAKIDTNIQGKEVNISIIVPDKEGINHVIANKYFPYAIQNTARIIVGEPNRPFIIDKKDIRPNIINDLERLHPFIRLNIMKQSVLKVYEITSPHICYTSIAPRLKVELRS